MLQQPFMCQVCRSWAALDRVVSAHNRNTSKPSKLSGGIFLYEAQAAQAIQLLQAIIKRKGAATVCETGFNAGHSTLLFLALPNTTVVTFDTFEREASLCLLRSKLNGQAACSCFKSQEATHTAHFTHGTKPDDITITSMMLV